MNINKLLISETKDLIGKTISKVITPDGCYESFYIKFTDGTYIELKKAEIGSGFESNEVIVLNEYQTINRNLVDLGIITKEEYSEYLIKEDEKYKEYQMKMDKVRLDRELEEEKELYEKLKNKFDN